MSEKYTPLRERRRHSSASTLAEPCAEPNLRDCPDVEISHLAKQVHEIRELQEHNTLVDKEGAVVPVGRHINDLWEKLTEERSQTFTDCTAIYNHIVRENKDRQEIVEKVFTKFTDLETSIDRIERDATRIVQSERRDRINDTRQFEKKFMAMDREFQKLRQNNDDLRDELESMRESQSSDTSLRSKSAIRSRPCADSETPEPAFTQDDIEVREGGAITRLITRASTRIESGIARGVELINWVPLLGPKVAGTVSSMLDLDSSRDCDQSTLSTRPNESTLL